MRFAPATNWPSRSVSSATIGALEPDRAERAALRAEARHDLVVGRRPKVGAERRLELRLLEAVVTAEEREHERAVVLDDRHRLRRRREIDREELRERLAGAGVRRLDLVGRVEPLGELGRARNGERDLEIGRIVTVLARHERVLARSGGREVVQRLLAAHHPALGRDATRLEAAALEDPLVGTLVRLEADVEAGLVPVERVRVLHHELADAEQAASGTRLVAVLRLEVVPGLRQLPVALELHRVEGERLLVRERKDVVTTVAVLELEELRDPVAAGLDPQLGRRQHRREHLLRTDCGQLLADHLLDFPVDAPAERQERPQARAHLADEASAHEQLVRERLGVGRRVAQGREVELRSAVDHRERLVKRRPPEAALQGSSRGQASAPADACSRSGGSAPLQTDQSSGMSEASAIASAAGFAIFRRFGRCMPASIQRSIS